MNLLKRTIYSKKFLVFTFFICIHLILLNINVAEWGDSYRILRASEFIRNGSYPEDEKRPPLFSVLLSLRPSNIDQVLWGRIELLVISFITFLVFYKILEITIRDEDFVNIGALLFALNPVVLYWSIRIMTDVLFLLWAVVIFWLIFKWKENFSIKRIVTLGLLCGLGILTRFEGYLLLASVAISVAFSQDFKIFDRLFKTIKHEAILVFSALIVLLPYLIYRNPFSSSYFEEPSGRVYDIKMVFIYLISVLFVFGFIPAFYFLLKSSRTIKYFFVGNPGILIFTILELILILLWPAAVPRLLLPIIPILVILLTISLKETLKSIYSLKDLFYIFTFYLIFGVGQYLLRLQFLIPQKSVLLIVFLMQTTFLVSLYYKKYYIFIMTLFISLLLWSSSVIYIHKDIFISVKSAAEYVNKYLDGVIGYNDVSSVSDWYINYATSDKDNKGFYYNSEKKKNLEYDELMESGIDYLLITNEHNTSMHLDIEKRPYLAIIKVFRYNVNGKNFFAEIIKLNK